MPARLYLPTYLPCSSLQLAVLAFSVSLCGLFIWRGFVGAEDRVCEGSAVVVLAGMFVRFMSGCCYRVWVVMLLKVSKCVPLLIGQSFLGGVVDLLAKLV